MVLEIFRPGLPGGRISLPWTIYFARHGQTDWNAERRFQGHSDIPLNETGRSQATRNGAALAADISRPELLNYYSSPLSRASETLEIIREQMGLQRKRYAIDDRLIEIDLGDWNGKTIDEINVEEHGAFDRREKDKWAFVVPGGESYANAAERTREFLLTLKGPSLIVGHGASGRILRGYLRGLKRDALPHLKARQDVAYKLKGRREIEL